LIQQETDLMQRAAELRLAFDSSFADAPAAASAPTTALLAIGVGSNSYALRLAEISGLYADKKITPVPTETRDLLGLTGFRGVLIPVYDLRSLLGYSVITATAAITMPRWLVLVASKTPVAMAFEQFDGYLGVAAELIVPETSRASGRPYVFGTVPTADGLRPIVGLDSILDSIRQRAQPGASQGRP